MNQLLNHWFVFPLNVHSCRIYLIMSVDFSVDCTADFTGTGSGGLAAG